MVRAGNRGGARAVFVGLDAVVPLVSRSHQERFWYDFLGCGFGVPGEGTTRVLRFARVATDRTPIDVGWTGVVSFRSGH